MRRVSILGVAIDNLSMDDALARISENVEGGHFACAFTPNVDHVMRLRRDSGFREVYKTAELVLADGVPLLWASKILGRPLKERVNGTDLFERICAVAAQREYSVYLLGGNPGSALKAGERLRAKHPSLNIAGSFCPDFGFEADPSQNRAIQERIQTSKADILFVGLGSPKQEEWIYRFARQSGVKLAVGIGISFSLVAGDIKRAPLWMQRSGLEWLWRLLSEPRRLWKRYLVDDLPFVGVVLWERLTHSDSIRAIVRKIKRAPSVAAEAE